MSKSLTLLLCICFLFAPREWLDGLAPKTVLHAQDSHDLSQVKRRFPVPVRQGVAVGREYFYAISNTEILVCDKAKGSIIKAWQPSKLQTHFTHLNSGTVIDKKLYCAHSRYPTDPNDNTIEVWKLAGSSIVHELSLAMPRKHGSLTWVDRKQDGSWWMCYAVYGVGKNSQTKLVKYSLKSDSAEPVFIEQKVWTFPKQVVARWGTKSCSGGSWGPDGLLYTSGHDDHQAYVLEIDSRQQLNYVRTIVDVGFYGQGIAWDRTTEQPLLWGIEKRKNVSATLLSPGVLQLPTKQ